MPRLHRDSQVTGADNRTRAEVVGGAGKGKLSTQDQQLQSLASIDSKLDTLLLMLAIIFGVDIPSVIQK